MSNRIKVLNLYAGIGGNRKLWTNVDVTAVEIDPKIAEIYHGFFPDDNVIVADAHQFLLEHFEEFDFIWSSPPCPSHSVCNNFIFAQGCIRYPDMKLYEEIIFLRHWFKGSWVVENVKPYYEPLLKPQYCGRHCFWANFRITDIPVKKDFHQFSNKGRSKRATGDKPVEERNMVNPVIGLHVFNCAFKIRQVKLGELEKPSEVKKR